MARNNGAKEKGEKSENVTTVHSLRPTLMLLLYLLSAATTTAICELFSLTNCRLKMEIPSSDQINSI